MGQLSFFDVSNRYASLDARKDPLVQIAAVVPFEGTLPATCAAPCNWITWMQHRVDHLQGTSLPKPQENRR